MLCSKCNKNIAVVFVTKLEGDKQTNEGLCLSCAKKLGIAPIEQFVGQMGITDEDIDAMNQEVSSLLENAESENPDNESDTSLNNPIAFIQKVFAAQNNTQNQPNDDGKKQQDGNKKTQTKQQEVKKLKKKRLLDTYGSNLTAKAAEGLVDRVIGREKEIARTIQILNRRTKNNPALLGEPGVGKTAIAEGLAMRIYEKKVPPKLFNREVYLLDFTAIVAGTQFRGQFEARLKSLIEEAKSLGNVILVIDELHNIVGAGDAEGAMNAANILKPALARGEIQVIGATTLSEYRKHIEKDTALERRFQPVIIDEPSISETIEIIKGIRPYYENYHHIKITDEIIKAAVHLSERYITERFLPDKAIDVIDEAGSLANLKNTSLVKLAEVKEEYIEVQRQREEAVAREDYKKAAELKSTELKLKSQIDELTREDQNISLTIDDIANVIQMWTNIPVSKITELESNKLLDLESRIAKRIVGQKQAIDGVCRAVRRRRAALSKKNRPVSFIFVGPTGVGKTELVKALSEVMFDSEEAIIRLDMSEYSEKHSVSKIIGSPPGYVGYDDAGQLTEKVRRKPYSIILLDEIEKAHPEVFNILLQILDDGRIADSHGKVVSFENTIIIMTSNAGSDLRMGNLGFISDENSANKQRIDTALKEVFRPEFLNRVDEIIAFNLLTRGELLSIIDLMLKDLEYGLNQKGIKLNVTDACKNAILDEGYNPLYGARPIRRVIQKKIEDNIAYMLIKNELHGNKTLTVDITDGEFIIKA